MLYHGLCKLQVDDGDGFEPPFFNPIHVHKYIIHICIHMHYS